MKARRGATVVGREHEVLSREAEECLFHAPEVMSEGSLRSAGDAPAWFGSTMITIDLARLASRWRGPFDEAARARLLRAAEGSVRVRIRAMRLACAEVARRLPDRSLGTAHVDTRVRIVGDRLHLDVDVEVPLDVSSARRRR
ncbi:MAG: hypothetical protein ACOC97_05735 [Myxococcota bacterium]